MMIKKHLGILVVLFSFNTALCNTPPKIGEDTQNGIIVATWNIGHFSQGRKEYSLIKDNYEHKLNEFQTFIYDSIKSDILCVNEFSAVFCKDSLGREVLSEEALFGSFRTKKVFMQNRFVCNALFAKRKLKHVKETSFLYNDIAKDDRPTILWHYYVMADIKIQGKKVKLICTHLVNRAEKHCQNQIEELVRVCEGYERVIICGDMNTWNFSKFIKAGYSLANDGTIVTFPSKSYALDNIIVKGLNLSEVRVLKTSLSDHYSLACRVTL